MPSTLTRPPRKTIPSQEIPVPDQARPPAPPPAVTGDEKILKAWNAATDDERRLGAELYELEARLHVSGIESYFRFAKWWHDRYPKVNKKNYQKGLGAVKGGAILSPFSVPQVYVIIRTISVYTCESYQELKAQAQANGVVITWTHLRTIANKLGKSEYKRIRQAVENQLVKKKMTEKQLLKLIAEYAPETITDIERSDSPRPGKVFKSFVSTLKRNVSQYQDFQDTINRIEQTILEENVEEVKTELQEALEMFDRMARFIEENRPRLENSLQSVSTATEQRPETERLTLAPGFNGEDDDDILDRSPKMAFRDDGDEDEFGPSGDEFDDEPDDWDILDEDEDDPVFDEIGNIPTRPTRHGRA